MSMSLPNNRHFVRLTTTTVGAVVWVALLAGFYVLVHCPLHSREKQQEERIEHLQKLLAIDSNVHTAHRELRKRVEELNAKIDTIRRRIPVRPLEETFLSHTTDIAKEERLAIGNFRREDSKDFPDYSEVDVVISGQGSYGSICRFLHRVSQLERLSTVRKLSIESDADDGNYPFEVIYSLQFGMQTAVDAKQGEEVL